MIFILASFQQTIHHLPRNKNDVEFNTKLNYCAIEVY